MQRKFPPTHEDQKAKKLMEKLADRLALLEKKQLHEDLSRASYRSVDDKPLQSDRFPDRIPEANARVR